MGNENFLATVDGRSWPMHVGVQKYYAHIFLILYDVSTAQERTVALYSYVHIINFPY